MTETITLPWMNKIRSMLKDESTTLADIVRELLVYGREEEKLLTARLRLNEYDYKESLFSKLQRRE